MAIQTVHKGWCHCGAVEFEVKLPNGLQDLYRCNCSMCSRRGAVAAAVDLADLKVIRGQETLTLYQFHTRTAEHFFCSICGIYTHQKLRSNPNQYGFNVACLEGVDPFRLGEIRVVDGANHVCDR